MNLEQKLIKNLNFTKKEARVYLVLLEFGQVNVSTIAKKTDINRVSIYEILRSLIKRGLVTKFKKNSMAFFNCLPPEKILEYLDHEKEQLNTKIDESKENIKSILPQLISMQNIYPAGRPKVEFFEGKKGMREAYEDALNAKDMILAYANTETLEKGLPNLFPNYYKRRVQKGIHARAIMPKNAETVKMAKRAKEEMRIVKFLPNTEQFSPEINIYNDKMLIVSWEEEMAVIVESKELIKLQKIIFNTLWDKLD